MRGVIAVIVCLLVASSVARNSLVDGEIECIKRATHFLEMMRCVPPDWEETCNTSAILNQMKLPLSYKESMDLISGNITVSITVKDLLYYLANKALVGLLCRQPRVDEIERFVNQTKRFRNVSGISEPELNEILEGPKEEFETIGQFMVKMGNFMAVVAMGRLFVEVIVIALLMVLLRILYRIVYWIVIRLENII